MEPTQNLTETDDGIDHKAIQTQVYVLTPQQQVWVDYKALGGIVFDVENETMRKMTVTELAFKLSVSRETLYAWREQIPGFWDRVAERRKESNSQEFLAKLHGVWKLKALAMKDWRITDAWLRNFDPDYREPKQKHELEIGDGLADALSAARERRHQTENVQEAEIVPKPSDN